MPESQIVRKIKRRNDDAKKEMDSAASDATVCTAHGSVSHAIGATMGNQEDIAEAIIESRNGAASISFGGMKITTHNVKDLIRVAQLAIVVYIALVLFGLIPSPQKLVHKPVSEVQPPITEVVMTK